MNCKKNCELAILIAKEHLSQPDSIVDNKDYWEQVYRQNSKEVKRMIMEEMLQKYF